jgi:hypothetical protein
MSMFMFDRPRLFIDGAWTPSRDGRTPEIPAGLPPDARERLFSTEWYIRHSPPHHCGIGPDGTDRLTFRGPAREEGGRDSWTLDFAGSLR